MSLMQQTMSDHKRHQLNTFTTAAPAIIDNDSSSAPALLPHPGKRTCHVLQRPCESICFTHLELFDHDDQVKQSLTACRKALNSTSLMRQPTSGR
jgi:hypothetical protein